MPRLLPPIVEEPLDNQLPPRYLSPTWSARVLKRSKLVFLLLLAAAVTCVSVMPMTDLPETAFNEIDTPVNQTTPVAPWVKFVPPVEVRFVLPRAFDHTKTTEFALRVVPYTLLFMKNTPARGKYPHWSPMNWLQITRAIMRASLRDAFAGRRG